LKRHRITSSLLVLHFATSAVFLLLREPGISFLDEREKMRRDWGYMFMVSGDAIMFIANRPLHAWSEWHGGEEAWVKVLEVLNLPALIATTTIGHIPIAIYRFSGRGNFVQDTWIRGVVFLLFSTLQWFLIGRAADRALIHGKVPPPN